jgi:hypothetical protein
MDARSVRLAHDQREGVTVPVLESVGEDAERALVLHQESLRCELVDHHREERVVEALPHHVLVGQQHTQHGVDLVVVAQALGYEDAPEVERLGVPAL